MARRHSGRSAKRASAEDRADERLAAERAALSQQHLDAKDTLTDASKADPNYPTTRRNLDVVQGRLREARKQEDAHEETHQDEFSG
jgi:hypothetical protein